MLKMLNKDRVTALLVIDKFGGQMNKTSRRKFFKKITFGGLGLALLSKSPLKAFTSDKKNKRLKKVFIHPNSVKRTK